MGKRIPGSRNGKCKGLEIGTRLMGSKTARSWGWLEDCEGWERRSGRWGHRGGKGSDHKRPQSSGKELFFLPFPVAGMHGSEENMPDLRASFVVSRGAEVRWVSAGRSTSWQGKSVESPLLGQLLTRGWASIPRLPRMFMEVPRVVPSNIKIILLSYWGICLFFLISLAMFQRRKCSFLAHPLTRTWPCVTKPLSFAWKEKGGVFFIQPRCIRFYTGSPHLFFFFC